MANSSTPFSARLLDVRDRHHSMHHPFFDLWCDGKLEKRAMGIYVIQHYFWTSEYFKQFGVAYAKAPLKVREFFIGNLAEEMGIIGMHGEAKKHEHLQKAWAYETGFSEDEIESFPWLPTTYALADHGWKICYTASWQVYVAVLVALESQEVGIQGRLVPALIERYGYQAGDAAIGFFEEHYVADQEHGRQALELLDEFTPSEAEVEEALEEAAIVCRLRWHHYNDIHRHGVLGEEFTLPARS